MQQEGFTGQFGTAFGSMVRSYSHCMETILKKYGLYPGQPQVLFAVKELVSPTQIELASYLRISRSAAGVSLKRLESAGFVRRERDALDSRRIKTVLTRRGEDFVKWCKIDFSVLFTTMLEDMDQTGRDCALLAVENIDRSLIRFYCRLSE